MKNLILVLAIIMSTMSFAQSKNVERGTEATKAGNYSVGLSSTSLGFNNVNDLTTFNVGTSVAKFVGQGFAIVGGVGYESAHLDNFNANNWVYNVGAKYYLGSVVPVQVDWNGATGNAYHPSKSYVGVQAGYAWFPSNHFSIEPALKYNFSTKDAYDNEFSGGLSFNYFF